MPSLYEQPFAFCAEEDLIEDGKGNDDNFLQEIIDFLDREESNMKLRSGEREDPCGIRMGLVNGFTEP